MFPTTDFSDEARMDRGIWATWYDLPDDGGQDYLSWLHEDYLPALKARPGVAWAAHYEITGGGPRMDQIHAKLARPDDPEVGTGAAYLILVGAASPHLFFGPGGRDDGDDAAARGALARRIGARGSVFVEQARVDGPEIGERAPGTAPGPAIQMGSFRTKTVADEFDLGAWYAQYRLPAMARMPGCIAARKLVSAAGWAKHSVLYEFTSLEAREAHFQNHESLALDEKEWTGRVIRYTIHAPGSPSVARRTWPAVEG